MVFDAFLSIYSVRIFPRVGHGVGQIQITKQTLEVLPIQNPVNNVGSTHLFLPLEQTSPPHTRLMDNLIP